MGTHKEKMTNTQVLDIVIRQLLTDLYACYGARASHIRSDAMGVLGLRTACKQLAEHNAKWWMRNTMSCLSGTVRHFRYELEDLMRIKFGEEWNLDDYLWYKRYCEGRLVKNRERRILKWGAMANLLLEKSPIIPNKSATTGNK